MEPFQKYHTDNRLGLAIRVSHSTSILGRRKHQFQLMKPSCSADLTHEYAIILSFFIEKYDDKSRQWVHVPVNGTVNGQKGYNVFFDDLYTKVVKADLE